MKLSDTTIKLIFSILYCILSIILLVSEQWLDFWPTTYCHKYLINRFFYISIFITFLLIGFLGLYIYSHRNTTNWLYVLYLFLLFAFIVLLFVLVLFIIFVTTHKTGEYSNWLDKRVDDSKTWKRVRACLVSQKTCRNFHPDKKHLSPIQSGCCKPPQNCGFMYIGPTTWNKTGTPTNPDCNAWDNNPSTFCYDCTPCKAGFLHSVKGDWKKVALLNLVYLCFLIILFPIGICAFCYNMWDNANCQVNPIKT